MVKYQVGICEKDDDFPIVIAVVAGIAVVSVIHVAVATLSMLLSEGGGSHLEFEDKGTRGCPRKERKLHDTNKN